MIAAAHYIPRSPLSDFVSVMWYWDGYVQPHAQERLLPDGAMTIALNLGEQRVSQYQGDDPGTYASAVAQVICGARSTYMVADTANMVTTFGIQFKPGGAFPFLRLPASELNEQCVSLEDVFGLSRNSLRDRLLGCAKPEQKFAAAERWLLAQAARPLEKHPAVEYATRQFVHGPILQRLSNMLDRVGYSQRHFNQLFSDEVGLTPKRFLRVRRFQNVISSIPRAKAVDWADLAVRCGYYDQSHFVHDFRSFCGLTPAAYLSLRTAHLNHVPISD
jgi:AraC-like DNA-binding protein